jgi:tyrosinase
LEQAQAETEMIKAQEINEPVESGSGKRALFPRMEANLPASAFPKFTPVSLEQAQAETEMLKAKELNETSTEEPHLMLEKRAQTPAAAACAKNPNVRIEWRNYSTSDRLAFIAAIKCLMGKPPVGRFSPPATNRYEDFVRLHQWYMPNVHGNGNFLVWHRYYLWTFEQTLRKECGFNRAMPWWDEPKDAGNFGKFDMFSSKDYFGNMVAYPNGAPVCIGSGAFSGLTCHIGPGQSNQNHCLSRANNDALTRQVSQAYVDTCNARSSYTDMASCSELGYVPLRSDAHIWCN